MYCNNEFQIHGRLASSVKRCSAPAHRISASYLVEVVDNSHVQGIADTHTNLIQITTYGKQAENDLTFLDRGKEVVIRGQIRGSYNERTGHMEYRFEPERGGVRYMGAPIRKAKTISSTDIHADWLLEYDAAWHKIEAVSPQTEPVRISVWNGVMK